LAQYQATVLFNGIGGIGKTALASKYMAVYGSNYKHLAWITVQSTLAEAFINNAPLLASLHITQQVQDHIAAKQLDKAFEYLFHQLNLLESTLVVIDNANNVDDLGQYKNWFDTANCHFLITSRSQPSEWATVEVDSLPEDEAVRLFRKLHATPTPRGENALLSPLGAVTDDMIKSLLSKLFYHTLLIELVAKAGVSTGISFADLQSMIEAQFIHHQSLNEAPIPTGKHGSVVATNLKKAKIENYIWLIFSQVKALDEDSKQLLKAMALLPVATSFDLIFLKEHFALFNIPNAIVHLNTLLERGWLQKEQAEGHKPYFKMHPLIAEVVVMQLNVNIAFSKLYIEFVAGLIYYNFLNPEHNLFKKNQYKLLAERLYELFFKDNTEEISDLLDNIGNLEEEFGFYHKAAAFKEKALQIILAIFEENHPKVAIRQNNLANVYRNLGQYKKASELLEKALTTYMKNLDEQHPSYSICQSDLANVYKYLGRYQEAAELLELALKIDLKNYDEDHPEVSKKQSNLALVYRNLGRYQEASELLEVALSNDLKNFYFEHPEIAKKRSNLGLVYRNLGRYQEAANLIEAAIESDVNNFGEKHPYIATKKSNLALVYKDLKRYEEAVSLLQESLESDIKNFGNNHPYVAVRLFNMGNIMRCLKKYDRSIELIESALKIDLENFGNYHPDVARKISGLGITYRYIGNLERSSDLLEMALKINIKNFGNMHPEIAIILNNLAHVYKKMNRESEAQELWQKSYKIRLKVFGEDHFFTKQVQENYSIYAKILNFT
jgi:tetratricopeptide (TPR) repeat protein